MGFNLSSSSCPRGGRSFPNYVCCRFSLKISKRHFSPPISSEFCTDVSKIYFSTSLPYPRQNQQPPFFSSDKQGVLQSFLEEKFNSKLLCKTTATYLRFFKKKSLQIGAGLAKLCPASLSLLFLLVPVLLPREKTQQTPTAPDAGFAA